MNRLGVFGGRFDPPHIAHMIHARLVQESFELDSVLFLPAANPPHKKAYASFEERAEMVRLAIEKEENLKLSLVEQQEELSYTLDTLTSLTFHFPGTKLYLIIGRDEYEYLSEWREPQRVMELAEFIVLPRAGIGRGVPPDGIHFPNLPLIDISSSLIRERIASGKSIRYLVPEPVEEFIHTHNLYKEVL